MVRSFGVMSCTVSFPLSLPLSVVVPISILRQKPCLNLKKASCHNLPLDHTHTVCPILVLTCQSNSPCHALCQTVYSLPSLSPLSPHSSLFVNRDEAVNGILFIISSSPISILPSIQPHLWSYNQLSSHFACYRNTLFTFLCHRTPFRLAKVFYCAGTARTNRTGRDLIFVTVSKLFKKEKNYLKMPEMPNILCS